MTDSSLPRGRLLLWALLVPFAYAPSFVLGAPPGLSETLVVVVAIMLAFLAVAALFRTTLLDRLEVRFGRAMPFVIALFAIVYTVLSVATARARLRGTRRLFDGGTVQPIVLDAASRSAVREHARNARRLARQPLRRPLLADTLDSGPVLSRMAASAVVARRAIARDRADSRAGVTRCSRRGSGAWARRCSVSPP
jgi:hypothetical protein